MKEPPSRRSSHSCPVVVHMLSPVVYVCCRPQWPPSVYIHLCRWPVIQFPAAAAAVLYLLRKTEVFTPKIGLGWVNWFTNGHSNPDNITKAVVQVQDQQMPPSHMPPNSELLLLYIPCKCGSVGYIGCRRLEQAGNVTLYTYIYPISHAVYYRVFLQSLQSCSLHLMANCPGEELVVDQFLHKTSHNSRAHTVHSVMRKHFPQRFSQIYVYNKFAAIRLFVRASTRCIRRDC